MFAFRVACLQQLHGALLENVERLRAVTVAEVEAPVILTRDPQVDSPIGLVKYYAKVASEYARTTGLAIPAFGAEEQAIKERHAARPCRLEPTGVVGLNIGWRVVH